MPKTEIPPAILASHPELLQVEIALCLYRSGKQVAVDCAKCGGAIAVHEVAETGTLLVTCPNGCTSFRAARGR